MVVTDISILRFNIKKMAGEKKDLTCSFKIFMVLHYFCNVVFFISSFLKSPLCVQGG